MPDDMLQDEPGGEEGAPEWIVTFSDMMSLLLTFFIMLLSMSSTDLVKYRQVVESLTGAFGSTTEETAQYEKSMPVTTDQITNENQAMQQIAKTISEMIQDSNLQKFVKMESKDDQLIISGKITEQVQANQTSQLIAQLNSIIASEKMEDMVKVVIDPRGIAVRITDRNLFDIGRADVKKESYRVLYKIGQLMNQVNDDILIEGHTDDLPIRTRQYPSNWELSSARAAGVARFLLQYCKIPKERVTVAGVADTRPIQQNANEENRSNNRRVEFIFLKKN